MCPGNRDPYSTTVTVTSRLSYAVTTTQTIAVVAGAQSTPRLMNVTIGAVASCPPETEFGKKAGQAHHEHSYYQRFNKQRVPRKMKT